MRESLPLLDYAVQINQHPADAVVAATAAGFPVRDRHGVGVRTHGEALAYAVNHGLTYAGLWVNLTPNNSESP